MAYDLTTLNFDHIVALCNKIQNCVERAYEYGRRDGVWLPNNRFETLCPSQVEAHRDQVKQIMEDAQPHKRCREGCTCGSTGLIPLWPRDLRCFFLEKETEPDALEPDLAFALDRIAYVVALKPHEEGPGLVHDLVYRAVRRRLADDDTTWPWTTATDVWACEPEIARRLGFESFSNAIFTAHVIWPSEHSKRTLTITAEPEVHSCDGSAFAPGSRAAHDQAANVTHIWDEMKHAILEDNTQHIFEPDYGCVCLQPVPAAHRPLTPETWQTGPTGSSVASDPDLGTRSETCENLAETSGEGVHALDEDGATECDGTDTRAITFTHGARLFTQIFCRNRDSILPQVERLFRIAPAKEFMPMLHQFLQNAMRHRVESAVTNEVDWYLLKAEDIKTCEERFLRAMGFEDHIEAHGLMSSLARDRHCPGLRAASLYT